MRERLATDTLSGIVRLREALGCAVPPPATAAQHMAASVWMQLDVEWSRRAIITINRELGLSTHISSMLGWEVQVGKSDGFHCSFEIVETQ